MGDFIFRIIPSSVLKKSITGKLFIKFVLRLFQCKDKAMLYNSSGVVPGH